MGIMIDCGPIETGVKHLFGGVVQAMMSPGGSIMASLMNINGSLVVNTPPDELTRTDFKQEGVVPKVMLHVFEKLVLWLGRHPINHKIPCMVVCKINKPLGKMVGGEVLGSFFITDDDIKFLKEENPPKQSRLSILLIKKENDFILKNKQTNMTSLKNSNLELKNMFGKFMKMNTASSSGSGTLSSNTINNPKDDLKGITTRNEIAYKGLVIPTTSSPTKVVEHETKVTKDTVPLTNNGSTKDVQPMVVQVETQVPNSEPVVSPVVEPVEDPITAPKPNPKPSILYPSRLNDEKLREKANNQMEKFF
nr:reverse transcriptase domain-containing protein [Tanacetum cinerariifolium]